MHLNTKNDEYEANVKFNLMILGVLLTVMKVKLKILYKHQII